jgi:hypothetical protein
MSALLRRLYTPYESHSNPISVLMCARRSRKKIAFGILQDEKSSVGGRQQVVGSHACGVRARICFLEIQRFDRFFICPS